jgi:hypothetical protein
MRPDTTLELTSSYRLKDGHLQRQAMYLKPDGSISEIRWVDIDEYGYARPTTDDRDTIVPKMPGSHET